MVNINLLPWREQLQIQRRRQLYLWVVSTLIFSLFCISLLNGMLFYKQHTLNMLVRSYQTQIDILKKSGPLFNLSHDAYVNGLDDHNFKQNIYPKDHVIANDNIPLNHHSQHLNAEQITKKLAYFKAVFNLLLRLSKDSNTETFCFTTINLQNQQLSFKAYAQTLYHLSVLLKSWQDNQMIKDIHITEIAERRNGSVFFALDAKIGKRQDLEI